MAAHAAPFAIVGQKSYSVIRAASCRARCDEEPRMKPLVCDTTLALCGLEPPEPMERVLAALPTLVDGRYLRMVIDREPLPLYALLTRGGFDYEVRGPHTGRYDIDIWRRR